MRLRTYRAAVAISKKNTAGKPCEAADRRGRPDTAGKAETRKPRKHGQLRGCGRREALTNGRGGVRRKGLAPQAGLEPATLRLTAECSTIELLRSTAFNVTFKQTKSLDVNRLFLVAILTPGVYRVRSRSKLQ